MKREWILGAAFFLGACSDDRGSEGTVTFTVWGEAYIEEGIPAGEFEDGWSVVFDRFLIVIGQIEVAQAGGSPHRLPDRRLFNLVTDGPHEVGTLDLASGTWDEVSYATPVFDGSTEKSGSASDDDMADMEEGPYSVRVSGTATRGDEDYEFDWAFAETIRYESCVAEEDGKETPGFSLPGGSNETVQLTIHGDHFFYDDLASADALLRFQPMADADDGDGNVTLTELSSVRLVDIPEGTYGTGGLSDVNDLGAFVAALVETLGHFRGEGHCVASR